ncbi:MAG: sensor histidine kinase [Pseudomonadota bacterium]
MIFGKWYRGLRVQLVALLTIALLPLGSIAIYQTAQLSVGARETANQALLAQTAEIAREEQLLIERAVGAARLFGAIAPALLDDPTQCQPLLGPFIDQDPDFSFVGVLPLSGVTDCSSFDAAIDFSGYPGFDDSMAAQASAIVANPAAPASGQSVIIVSEPFEVDGVFAGLVSVSIPHENLPETNSLTTAPGLVDLLTFNDAGQVLTARASLERAAEELPAAIDLVDLGQGAQQFFEADNARGVTRGYSVVSIEGAPFTVMAVWERDVLGSSWMTKVLSASLFPVLMWFASMAVALMAMETLVLQHLRRLRVNMDSFAQDRQTFATSPDRAFYPTELANLEENFRRMSADVLQDEAKLENALHEKGVLVKEIHHRVKNNLQLISSIINMQIRSAKEDETRGVLRRIQDRVVGLATIHRDLYQTEDAGRVDAGALVIEIVEKSLDIASEDGAEVALKLAIAPVRLFPDQAVPLSLLVAEAATNAMKYMGANPLANPVMQVRLSQVSDIVSLTMTNSVGDTPKAESGGMGSQLMRAFAMQLGGQISVEQTEDCYTLAVEFTVSEFEPGFRDY